MPQKREYIMWSGNVRQLPMKERIRATAKAGCDVLTLSPWDWMDVLRSGFCGDISLDQLAAEACLSKYHFLRLFRTAYGLSPYQYIQHLRIEKARVLLAGSVMPITDVAGLLGFDNSQSFSRLFFQRMGVYPTQYRLQAK